ncbi:HesB/YadR/YfhF family protein [Evansella clarkii]|jgi:uncharacterized protein YneR|uniref:HesB/YadR/YfhF family protein n=1 Tax=Evansella clarkii TaxID=79879 RepID=UPI000997DCB3|nr:iron-sulfur cluster biosynthesis family protein [Evansella clarkii]
MQLTITENAANLYKKEMSLKEGDVLALFVRVGGIGSGGFSAGVKKGRPDGDYTEVTSGGLVFSVSDEEIWYFDGMTIDFDEDMQELTFDNPKIDNVINPL